MAKLKVSNIAECVSQLMEIEFRAVLDTVKKAKKSKEEETVLMGQSYAMGLQRAADIINAVLKDVVDD